jgi:hypothetical protein
VRLTGGLRLLATYLHVDDALLISMCWPIMLQQCFKAAIWKIKPQPCGQLTSGRSANEEIPQGAPNAMPSAS